MSSERSIHQADPFGEPKKTQEVITFLDDALFPGHDDDEALVDMQEVVVDPTAALFYTEHLGGTVAAAMRKADERGWHILHFAVHAEHRGQGLGSELLDHMEMEAQTAGAESIRAYPGDNSAALFFEDRGYAPNTRPGQEGTLIKTLTIE